MHKFQSVMQAYCLGCKAQRSVRDIKQSTTKKGQPMVQGTCEKCGRKVSKFIKKG